MAGLMDFFTSGAGQRSLAALGSGLLANASGPGGLGGGAPSTAQAFGRALPGAIDAYDQYQQQERRKRVQDLQLQQLEGAVQDAQTRRERASAARDALLGTQPTMQANTLSTGAPGQVQGFFSPGQESVLGLNPQQRAAAAALGDDQVASLLADRSGLNRNIRRLSPQETQQLGFPEGSVVQLDERTGAISPVREGFDENAYRTRQSINFGYQDRLAANAAARRAAQDSGGSKATLALLQSLGATPEQMAGYQLGSSSYRDQLLSALQGDNRPGQQTAPVADSTPLGDAFGLVNNASGAVGGLLDYATNGTVGGEIGASQRAAEAVVNSINTDLREAMQPIGSRAAVWDRQQANQLLPQPGSTGSATAQKRYQQISSVYLPRQIQSLQQALASGELGTSDTGKARQRLIQAQNLKNQLDQYLGNWDGGGQNGASGSWSSEDQQLLDKYLQ